MSELDANIIVDGQKVVATLAQSGDVIKDGGAIDATSVIQTDDGPQKVVKVMDINGGGGGGGTVDQTYDPTSTNAQSGTAVAEAVAPALKNTATGTNSLSINGVGATYTNSVNIGYNSGVGAQDAVAIGASAEARGEKSTKINQGSALYMATGVGYGTSSGQISVSLGSYASTLNTIGAIAIGGAGGPDYKTKATATRAIAIGSYGYDTNLKVEATAQDAIQLGAGVNSTANTFQVYTYPMLDGTTGKIPMARLPIVQISQADYDALVAAGTVDANTLYLII